jgi:anthranilate phosphoribosyltransferase
VLKELLARVADGVVLKSDEAAAAMRAMISGEASPALAGAFLTALKMRGETAGEIAGFARAMREHAVRIEPRCPRLVDTCGTGGGSVPTFNISTAAAFVVAGAGVSVAKHGNRAMTSLCGSADVLEALGVCIDLSPEQVCACVEQVGIGFMFAQAHHPAMRHVGPVRKELPFRTVFNMLGPLTNPAGAHAQVVGVYEARLVPLLAEALRELGSERALVVHGQDGLDELSTLGPTIGAQLRNGEIHRCEILPQHLGLAPVSVTAIAPGKDAAENAAILRGVLQGEPGPHREIVLLNAAAALWVAGAAAGLTGGLRMAAESIDNGTALRKLDELVRMTNAA